jgi:hypothetical protein
VCFYRLAEEELLREAKQAVARAEISGIEGFRKCPLPRANKRFLTNTIVNNIKSNRIKESKKELRKNTPYPSSNFAMGSKKSTSKCHKYDKIGKDEHSKR